MLNQYTLDYRMKFRDIDNNLLICTDITVFASLYVNSLKNKINIHCRLGGVGSE